MAALFELAALTLLPYSLVFGLLSGLGKSDINENKSLKPLAEKRCYLDIWDIPISSDTGAISVASVRKPSLLRESLSSLGQNLGAVRVVIEEVYDNPFFATWVRDLGDLPDRSDCDKTFKTLVSQWKRVTTLLQKDRWCELEGFGFFTDRSDSGGRRWLFLRRLREILQRLHGFRETWALTSRKMLMKDHGGGSIVFISCATFAANQDVIDRLETALDQPFDITKRFADELQQLSGTYGPIMTDHNWRQVFALLYYHVNLNLFADFLQRLTTKYFELRRLDFDPRLFKLRQWLVKEITKDSYQYQQFKHVGNEMVTTVESLLSVVEAAETLYVRGEPPGDHRMSNSKSAFATLKPELDGICKDVKLRLSRLSDDLKHDLKFLDLSRNASQAVSVQQLTILATVFLPMSLATGLLSMGTRFRDLGPLLYDFFGVLALIVTFVLFLLLALFLVAALKERSGVEKFKMYRKYWPLVAAFLGLLLLVYGSLVLTSFLVGMFDDVALGAKILGFGTAAMVFAPVTALLFFSGYKFLRDRVYRVVQTIGDVVQQQKDRRQNTNQQRKEKQKQKQAVPDGGILELGPPQPDLDIGPDTKPKLQDTKESIEAPHDGGKI